MAVIRFDAVRHVYYLDGLEVPHITGLLGSAGLVDSRWYTEESSRRGTAIHKLTEDYDLGALDPVRCTSAYKGYLLSHVEMMRRLKPEILEVELAQVHVGHGFGGRPDREMVMYGELSILEGKSGEVSDAHNVQTALQAILVAPKYGKAPEAIPRFCIYWRADGRAKLYEHPDRRDFEKAYRILDKFCKGGRSVASNQLQTTAIGEARAVPQAARAQGRRGRGKGKGSAAR